MSSPHLSAVAAKDILGFKDLNEVLPLLRRPRPCGHAPGRAGNRKFFFDHYVARLLLYFSNPVLTSRNALLQASHSAWGRGEGGGGSGCGLHGPGRKESEPKDST